MPRLSRTSQPLRLEFVCCVLQTRWRGRSGDRSEPRSARLVYCGCCCCYFGWSPLRPHLSHGCPAPPPALALGTRWTVVGADWWRCLKTCLPGRGACECCFLRAPRVLGAVTWGWGGWGATPRRVCGFSCVCVCEVVWLGTVTVECSDEIVRRVGGGGLEERGWAWEVCRREACASLGSGGEWA